MNRILIIAITWVFSTAALSQDLKYPVSRKVNQSDDYHGTPVQDPYRWLEDDGSEETKGWVNDQNKVTGEYLNTIPFLSGMKDRMKANWNVLRYETPFRCGPNYYYYRHDGVNNQPLLFMLKRLDYVPFMVFDPNKISADGTTSITSTVPSPDGSYLGFQISGAGSDWNEIRIKDAKTMKSLPEILGGVKFSNIAWYKNGFFYSRYDIQGATNAANEFHKIYYHRLNTPQEKDSLVWSDKEHPKRNYSASVTEDQHYLIISGSESTSGNSLFIVDLQKAGSKINPVITTFNYDFDCLGSYKNRIYFLTDNQAPARKIVAYDLTKPDQPVWVDIVPQQKEVIQSACLAYDKVVVHYMKNASSFLSVYKRDGQKDRDIVMDEIGTVEAMSGSQGDSVLFFSFVTFTKPSVIYRFDIRNNTLGLQFKSPLPYNPDDFITEQVFYESKDGTKIPMFLVHKKNIKKEGNTPTLLFGYGGFNISKTPEFKPERLVFLQEGGLFAMPNLRGGGEFGSEWHEAGTKLKKQNVFDDFIAAAEYLINNKYTNSDHLAIGGRSNGGLLVGAVMTQRPDLFKVALPAVGVMDMLRFQKFTIGWAWTGDYGSSDNKEEFAALYKYSPYHNLRSGEIYPATFITTADHDDRVVPGHSFKFAARLQEYQTGSSPVLIRIDKNAGHGAGKATSKLIDEQSDIFAFLFYHLGMKL